MDNKRRKASEYTKKFIKEMENNPTLKHRKINKYNMHYMITGFVCHDKADMRRMATRNNIIM